MRADLSMNGKKITGVAPGQDEDDVATVRQLSTSGGVPIGAVIDFWGSTPPDGFFFAAGQEMSRADYAELFAVIKTNAGAGNGSTTFNLPDYRGRIAAGRESMASPTTTRLNSLSSSTLGAVGGAQSHTLTEAQMPSHKHGITDPGHTHTASTAGGATGVRSGFEEFAATVSGPSATSSSTTGIMVANAGGGEAHNNVQPTIICNKIIRVK